MISLQVFMLGVLTASTLTTLTTEAIKMILVEHGKKYYANTLAGIVSVFLSLGIGISYLLISKIGFITEAIVYLMSLIVISWLCAMVGYDKVVQTISQLKASNTDSNN